MSYQNDSETHAKILTDVCQNVCAFMKTITIDNMSKDEKISSFVTKIDDLQLLCSELNTKFIKINEHIKTLADSLHFTFNPDESAIDLLIRWNSSLLKKNVYSKKRKLYSAYSPLKLSLKDKNEGTESKSKSTKYEKENKVSSQNELKHVWKLQTKRDGKPIDLLKKSKQTTLEFKLQEKKVKMDITTISSSTPKKSTLNLTGNFSPEILSMKNNSVPQNICENNSIHENQMRDNCINTCSSHISKEVILKSPSILNPKILIKNNVCENNLINISQIDVDDTYVSLNHFNKVFKDEKNVSTKNDIFKSNDSNAACLLTEKHDQSCDEIICSPIKVLKCEVSSKIQRKIPNTNLLDSFDIIPGLNDKQNDLPNYNFKGDPVRKQSERKLLNGWDCEDCCKFYEANNDNPVEAKKAMNHFSRHRSVKHQHHASTPPGFWDPI